MRLRDNSTGAPSKQARSALALRFIGIALLLLTVHYCCPSKDFSHFTHGRTVLTFLYRNT